MTRAPMTVYIREFGDCHLPNDGHHHPHHVYNFPEDPDNPANPARNVCLKCGEHIIMIKEP